MIADQAKITSRARELAMSGEYQYVYQIERAMQVEGLRGVDRAFRGQPHLRGELRELIAKHRPT